MGNEKENDNTNKVNRNRSSFDKEIATPYRNTKKVNIIDVPGDTNKLKNFQAEFGPSVIRKFQDDLALGRNAVNAFKIPSDVYVHFAFNLTTNLRSNLVTHILDNVVSNSTSGLGASLLDNLALTKSPDVLVILNGNLPNFTCGFSSKSTDLPTYINNNLATATQYTLLDDLERNALSNLGSNVFTNLKQNMHSNVESNLISVFLGNIRAWIIWKKEFLNAERRTNRTTNRNPVLSHLGSAIRYVYLYNNIESMKINKLMF